MDIERMSQRVARGAELLDRHLPGWEARINSATLSTATTARCVLGQAFGSFDRGCDALRIDGALGAAAYGFSLTPFLVPADGEGYGDGSPFDRYWKELDAEWKVFLQERSLVGLA